MKKVLENGSIQSAVPVQPVWPKEPRGRMRVLLRQELAAGALGLSTGLEYDPGIYSAPSEVLALAKVAGSAGGRYISHIRSEDRDFWSALEEVITIGRVHHMPVQVSHIKLGMRDLWGRADSVVRVLNRAGKPSIKVANEYLKTQKDLTTDFNLKFLFEALTEADSHIFDLFLENKDKIAAAEKSMTVDARIEKACGRTVKKAIEFRSLDLLKEAQKKMERALPARAEKWSTEAEMRFFGATNDLDGYLEACKDCQKKEAKGDASKLYNLAKELVDHFPKEPKALKQAEKWSKMAAENGGLFEYWMQYAQLLKLNGKPKDARSATLKAKKLADEKKDASLINQAESFLNLLDEESKS